MTPRHGKTCLVTTIMERFVPGTLVTVGTFLKHHPRLDADVVIHDGLTEAKREMLAAAFDGARFALVAPRGGATKKPGTDMPEMAGVPCKHRRAPCPAGRREPAARRS